MARGSPIVPLRVPEQLLARIDADVKRSIQEDDSPRSTRTSWILDAIYRVFTQRARAKKARKRQQAQRLALRSEKVPHTFDPEVVGKNRG